MTSIKLSQQTYDEFQRLKSIMAQLLDKDEVDDDQVIGSLVGWFLDSLNHETIGHVHMPHKQWWCCGGTCHTNTHSHKKENCCGGSCSHH